MRYPLPLTWLPERTRLILLAIAFLAHSETAGRQGLTLHISHIVFEFRNMSHGKARHA